jgi:hypothetical protein
MQDAAIEGILELIGTGVEAVLFAILTIAGVISEQIGVTSVSSGDLIGLWYVYVGVIALYAGVYLIGYKRLLPRVSGSAGGA